VADLDREQRDPPAEKSLGDHRYTVYFWWLMEFCGGSKGRAEGSTPIFDTNLQNNKYLVPKMTAFLDFLGILDPSLELVSIVIFHARKENSCRIHAEEYILVQESILTTG
jgi:hypothetical protein